MKIVVSPAKSLNFESPLPIQNYTESLFLKEAETIQKTLKKALTRGRQFDIITKLSQTRATQKN